MSSADISAPAVEATPTRERVTEVASVDNDAAAQNQSPPPASTASTTTVAAASTTTDAVLAELQKLNDLNTSKFVNGNAAAADANNVSSVSTIHNSITTINAKNSVPTSTTTTNSNNNITIASAAAFNEKGLATSNADSILLSMLDSEVHRLKVLERTSKEGLERYERDGKRLTVLLAMSHDQLEQLKSRNEKLNDLVDANSKEIAQLKDKNALLEKKFKLATEDKQAFKVMSDQNNTAGKALTVKLELENKLHLETIERLRSDCAAVERQRSEENALAEIERRKAFEMRVALETRLKTVEEEVSFLQEQRQKEIKAATLREYDLSVLVQTLKKEVNALKSSGESTSKTAFETMSAARIENITLTDRCNLLEKQLEEEKRSNLQNLTQLQVLFAAKSEQLEQQEASAKAREKVLETQIQKLITDLKSAQTEVNTLADRENSKNEAHVTEVIRLNSELNVLNLRLTDTLQEIERLKAKIHQQTIDAAIAKENATSLLTQTVREHQEKLSLKTNELNTVSVELHWKSEKLASTEQRLEALLEEMTQLKDRHQLESTAFKREIEGYKQVVAKLNNHIDANVENKLLMEQNHDLQSQIATMKGQLSAMNAALSHARVEMDISDTHNNLLLLDQVEGQTARLNALEKERLEVRPLLEKLALYFIGSTASSPMLLLTNGTNNANNNTQLLLENGGNNNNNTSTSTTTNTNAGGGGVDSSAIAGLLAITNRSVHSAGGGGGGSGGTSATSNNKAVSFQRGGGGGPSSSSTPSKNFVGGADLNISNTSAALAGGGGGGSRGVDLEVLQQLKAEEASLQRTIDAFYHRFGGTPAGLGAMLSFSSGTSGGGLNNIVSSSSSGGGVNTFANVSSSLPMIPTSRIKRVN